MCLLEAIQIVALDIHFELVGVCSRLEVGEGEIGWHREGSLRRVTVSIVAHHLVNVVTTLFIWKLGEVRCEVKTDEVVPV